MRRSTLHWHALDRLLDEALALPVADRMAWLDRLQGDDRELRPLLQKLLTEPELLTTRPPLDTLPKLAHRDTAYAPAAAMPGQHIGPYRLLEPLGSGGMGSVWLAERVDGVLQRRVALKLPLHLGSTSGLAERMARERRILAALEHPHIARLYDAGIAEDGRPYLALEYIPGVPIDQYCRERSPDLRALLELILQLARALAYAHAHLIVHRDLKPSNVQVDAQGQVHLLDFGVATLLEGRGQGDVTADSRLTRQLGAAMTLDYASPEQIRGEPVTTSSDVYSLGVLLYELLAGRRPYSIQSKDLLSTARTITELEPPPPSAVCAAAQRARELRGDLDTIVLKCLRKAPTERYLTVGELSDDLMRHLRNEPVRARPATLGLRARKFLGRNRVAVVGATLVFLSLCAGLVATAWQAHRAHAQEELARAAQVRAEQRFRDARALTHSILFDYHDAVRKLPGSTPVRMRLVHDALEYLDRMSRDAANDLPLQRELASAYDRLSDVQGGTMFQNLGDTAGALQSALKALQLRDRIARSDPRDAGAELDRALSQRRIALLHWELGRIQLASDEARRSLWMLEGLAAAAPAVSGVQRALVQTHSYLGLILQERGDLGGAQGEFTHSAELLQRAYAAQPEDPEHLRLLANVRENQGNTHQLAGEYAIALQRHREALGLRERLEHRDPVNAEYARSVLVSWYNIGQAQAELGDFEGALASFRRDEVIAVRLRRNDPDNEEYRGDWAYDQIRIGDMLMKLGLPGEALERYRGSFALRTADVKADPENLWKRSSLIEARSKIAQALAASGLPGALDEARRAVALLDATTLEDQNTAIRSFFAETYADLGALDVALARSRGAAASSAQSADGRELLRKAEALWSALDSAGRLSARDRQRRAAAAKLLGSVSGTPRKSRLRRVERARPHN